MNIKYNPRHSLAAEITKAASKQTYYTIRFFVDRDLVGDAYRAYGYFRWVDDYIDSQSDSQSANLAFINRQREILDACYRGETPLDLSPEENMLANLVSHDNGENPGLKSYLYRMMAVMEFDGRRRGNVISQSQLSEYTQNLAVAVTDAMHYFIGHDDPAPAIETRYLAVIAAHITHMLRDTLEDNEAGYFNIPKETIIKTGITPKDTENPAYQEWILSRVQTARQLFEEGQVNLSQVKNFRCRLAGYAYTARFEWMLRAIEQDNYCLRPEYPEHKGLQAGLWMITRTLSSVISSVWLVSRPSTSEVRAIQVKSYEN